MPKAARRYGAMVRCPSACRWRQPEASNPHQPTRAAVTHSEAARRPELPGVFIFIRQRRRPEAPGLLSRPCRLADAEEVLLPADEKPVRYRDNRGDQAI